MPMSTYLLDARQAGEPCPMGNTSPDTWGTIEAEAVRLRRR
jgi:hypothetical protein